MECVTNPDQQEWFSTREAADRIRFSPRTLASWRDAGKGPAFIKIGGRCRYKRNWLDRFMAEEVALETAGTPEAAHQP